MTSKAIVRRVTQNRMVTKGYRKGVYDRVTEETCPLKLKKNVIFGVFERMFSSRADLFREVNSVKDSVQLSAGWTEDLGTR